MSELASTERTENLNIVTILRHGRLQGVFRYYFIDMELGAFTLEDYIRSQFTSTELGFDWSFLATPDLSVVQRNCPPVVRLENWCTIGVHITSGLKYMHSHRYVHRDLKPANGIQPHLKANRNSVILLQGEFVEVNGLRNLRPNTNKRNHHRIFQRHTELPCT